MDRVQHNKQRRFMVILALAFLIAFTGCGKEDTGSKINEIEKIAIETMETTPTEAVPAETESSTKGDLSMEDCQGTTGIYIAHEDGSFTKYYGGGYLDTDGTVYADGLFLRNDIAEENPSIGKDDKLVVFCDSNYSLSLLPVKWESGSIATSLEDGTRAYICAERCDKDGAHFYVYTSKGERAYKKVMYIDGILATEYPFDIVGDENGGSVGYSLPKGAMVELAVVNGASLVEETYMVNSTYYNCEVKRSASLFSEEQHYLYPTPTLDGYAVIDIYDGFQNIEVPAGKYVMELRMGRSYIAYLLNWENA